MASSSVKVELESDVAPSSTQTSSKLDFDDTTLRAIAEVYKTEGNDEYKKKEFSSAIDFYTKGIQVNCNDEQLCAILYTNRATAHFCLGNYHDTLADAKTARKLQPAYMKAIVRGASACEKLHLYEEAITWCDEGLAIPGQPIKKLLEIRTRSLSLKTRLHSNDEKRSEFETPTKSPKSDDLKQAIAYYMLQLDIARLKGDTKCEGQAYGSLGIACQRLCDFKQAIEYHKAQMAIMKKIGDQVEVGRAYGNLGVAYSSLGDFGQAIDHQTLSLAVAKEMGDKIGEINAYANLGIAYRNLGDFKQAINFHRLHLDAAKAMGDRPGEGKAYNNLGVAYHCLSDFKQAIGYHELNLAIAKEEGDKFMEGSAYCNLGICYGSLCDFEKAVDYLKLHLTITKELGNRVQEGRAYGNLGIAYFSLSLFKEAIGYHELQLSIATELGDRVGEGAAYSSLGNVSRGRGDFKQAIEYYKVQLAISKEVGDRAGVGRGHTNLGVAFNGLCDFKQAIHHHTLSLDIAEEVGDKTGVGTSYGNLGNAYGSLSDYKQAIKYQKLSLSICKSLGDRAGEGQAFGSLGICYYHLGNLKQSIDHATSSLAIAKEIGDKDREGSAYGHLGTAYQRLGDYKEAIYYHKLHLAIGKQVGNRAAEAMAYGNLGMAFSSLGNFKQAIDYQKLCLDFAREQGAKDGEGSAYCKLGIAYQRFGDSKEAIQQYKLQLAISKDIGSRYGEASAHSNLGSVYLHLSDLKKSIEHYKVCLAITQKVGDRTGEGSAYANLGISYAQLGDFKQATDFLSLGLAIAKEVGNRAGECSVYGNLGIIYRRLGDFKQAIHYHKLQLAIAKEVGDMDEEGKTHYHLGTCFESVGSLCEALDCYRTSVLLLNNLRRLLQFHDQWKIGFRNENQSVYIALWSVLLKQGHNFEALCAAEKGRAQALADLMESQYHLRSRQPELDESEVTIPYLSSCRSATTVYLALDRSALSIWVLVEDNKVHFRRNEIDAKLFSGDAASWFQSLLENTHKTVGVRALIKCENRSLDAPRNGNNAVNNEELKCEALNLSDDQVNPLRTLYESIIGPIADLLQGNELTIIPDGPLFLVPYAAFLDSQSCHLCESVRYRVIPSLTSLKLIADSPADYHRSSGALIVGDPCTSEIVDKRGRTLLAALPCAKKEAEIIGRILTNLPLTGAEATKAEVLRRLSSVALVHIAAHGSSATGEIALAPNCIRASRIPKQGDYMLTMADVLSAQLRAKVVVLSCCHSGRGEVKAEGIVGIARAFLGAGARCVLVSLWAVDDEATLEFMSSFYQELVAGKKASQALNHAMKVLKASDQFSDVKYWAPFTLIGDDVTLEWGKKYK